MVDTVALVRVATRRRIRTVGEAGVAATAAAGIVGVAAVILEVVAAMDVVGLECPKVVRAGHLQIHQALFEFSIEIMFGSSVFTSEGIVCAQNASSAPCPSLSGHSFPASLSPRYTRYGILASGPCSCSSIP